MRWLKRWSLGFALLLVGLVVVHGGSPERAGQPGDQVSSSSSSVGPNLSVASGVERFSFASLHAEAPGLRVHEPSGANCLTVWALPAGTQAWLDLEVSFDVEGSTGDLFVHVDAVRPGDYVTVHAEADTAPVSVSIGPFVAGTGAGEGDPASVVALEAPANEAARYEAVVEYEFKTASAGPPDVVRGRCR